MKTKSYLPILIAVLIPASGGWSDESKDTAKATNAVGNVPIFQKLSDIKWQKMLPDLGENSPEACFLYVDPKTHATQLLVRAPKAIHIRKHWHSANETHMIITGTVTFECEGKRAELGPGSFNYMPAKMVHEAWLPADSLTFITVDGAWDVNWVEGPPRAADLTK